MSHPRPLPSTFPVPYRNPPPPLCPPASPFLLIFVSFSPVYARCPIFSLLVFVVVLRPWRTASTRAMRIRASTGLGQPETRPSKELEPLKVKGESPVPPLKAVIVLLWFKLLWVCSSVLSAVPILSCSIVLHCNWFLLPRKSRYNRGSYLSYVPLLN